MKKLLKGIYGLIPFKQFFFGILKLVWKPPESIYRHLHFKGVIKVRVDNANSFKMRNYGYEIENNLFWGGLKSKWERQSVNVWTKLCSHSDIIFDIGANTGVYSLLAKSINSDSKVYAFEPVKRVYERLVVNNDLNQFDIKCIEIAVSDKNGTALMYDQDSEHEYIASLNKDPNLSQSYEVNTITLDRFISDFRIERIDLMKIDVEYHEPEVLLGFKNNIRKLKPSILIEVLTDEIGQKVADLVDGMNYLYYTINEETGLKRVDKISKSESYNYLLCSERIAKVLELS